MSIDMRAHLSMPALLRYVAPSIAMMIFTSIYTVVDGFFVSNFAGKTAFAAVNFAMPYIMVLSSAGFMVGAGGSALIAQTRGKGNEARANQLFSQAVYFALLVGIVCALVGAFTVGPLCALLGAQGELLDLCVQYSRVIFVSLPGYVLQCAFQSLFSTAGKPKYGLYVILFAGITNIVLDIVLVGVLGFGLMGAAWATVVGELIGGFVPLLYFARKNASFFQLQRVRFEGRYLARVCVNGSSEMVSNMAVSLVGMLYNFQLIRLLGEDGVAAYGVIMYVVLVFNAIFIGFAMGVSPLMSFQYGARNRVEQQSLFRKGLAFAALGGVAMFALAQLGAGLVSGIFVDYDEGLRALTEQAFRLYALSFLFMGFPLYASSLFTSLNNGMVSALISFLRTLVFEAGAVLLVPQLVGAAGIWLAAPVAELSAVVVSAVLMAALGRTYGFLPEA